MSHNSHVLFHCQLENKENIGWLTFRFDHKKKLSQSSSEKERYVCACTFVRV